MSPKSRFLFTLLVAVIGGLGIIVAWAITGRDWVVYLVFPWLLVGTRMLYQIVCPKCGTPVAYSARVGKVRILSAIPRQTCEQCGCDLTVTAATADPERGR